MASPQNAVAESTSTTKPQTKNGRLSRPESVQGEFLWPYALMITLLHLTALLVFHPWFFSWTGLIVMVLGIHFYGQGISACYHRLLTHHSFKTPKWFERLWVIISLCCMQDTPARWVSNHRFHHSHSDEQSDPHSPLVSFFWSHTGWLFYRNREIQNATMLQKHARDILQDPFYMKLEKTPLAYIIYAIHAALHFLVGMLIGWLKTGGSPMEGVQFGLSLLVWGVLLRTVVVWHITWSVNSLTHLFGYRNYETNEKSRNNWLVALLSFGEGWHNNHHYDQVAATVQHRWWEIDIIYYELKLLEKLGLVYDIVPPKHVRAAKRAKG